MYVYIQYTSRKQAYVVSLLLLLFLLFIKHFSTSEHDFSFSSSGFYSLLSFLHGNFIHGNVMLFLQDRGATHGNTVTSHYTRLYELQIRISVERAHKTQQIHRTVHAN